VPTTTPWWKRVNFPAPFEGAPGLVHGGIVAAALGEMVGLTHAVAHAPGPAETLRIRFVSPCPLRTELRVVGTVTESDGRNSLVKATIQTADRVVAEAEGTFIVRAQPKA
jgi:acyl-coenzyme A thioesterase PaaI-like protein